MEQSLSWCNKRLIGKYFTYKSKNWGRCRVCNRKIFPTIGKKKDKKTQNYCPKCEVFLCVGQCFDTFHTRTTFWYFQHLRLSSKWFLFVVFLSDTWVTLTTFLVELFHCVSFYRDSSHSWLKWFLFHIIMLTIIYIFLDVHVHGIMHTCTCMNGMC